MPEAVEGLTPSEVSAIRVRAAATRRLRAAQAHVARIDAGAAGAGTDRWLARMRREQRQGRVGAETVSYLDDALPGWTVRSVQQLLAERSGDAPLRLRGDAFLEGFITAVRAGRANVYHARFLAEQKRGVGATTSTIAALTGLHPSWRTMSLADLMHAHGLLAAAPRRRSSLIDRITRFASGTHEPSDRHWLAKQKDAARLGRLPADVAAILAAVDPNWRQHTLGQIVECASGGRYKARGDCWARAERGALGENAASSLTWLRKHRRALEEGRLDPFTAARLAECLPGWETLTVTQLDEAHARRATPHLSRSAA